jgi:hypothetical protein
MVQKFKKDIIAFYKNRKAVQSIYKGSYLIWQSIRSCFGSGAWFNEKPWINDEAWKNN